MNFLKTAAYVSLGLLCIIGCTSEKKKLSDSIHGDEEILMKDSSGIMNQPVSIRTLHEYLEYSEKFPEDTLSPEYLVRAADLSNGMKQYRQSVDLFGKMLKNYPGHRKAAAALFMQAFVYETSLHQKDSAIAKYNEFLQKYPSHSLAPSAKASLEQLNSGLSDEELIRKFEAQMNSAAK